MKTIYTLLISSFCSFAFAQIASVSPSAQSITAAADENIVVEFEQLMDPNSIDDLSFRVFGRWSGPAEGEVSWENDGKRMVFTPDEPFFAGEWITVNFSKNIKNATGEAVGKGYAWNFWIATKGGSLQQSLVKTIPMRESGEGLIQTYGAYAGDLNNDGFSDLTVINETSDDLRILLNDGAGGYTNFSTLRMGASTPSPNEGADFNHDGEIDLAVSTAHGSEVRVLMGDGQGGFSSQDNYETGFGARGLGVLDCDADGHDDIFIANRLSDDLTLLTNDGEGNFTTQTLNTPGDGETACAIADANNDGIMDVFLGTFESRELAILLGDGEGGFTLSHRIPVSGQPWMIAVGDLNKDGFVDVVSSNSSGNVSVLAMGDGTGKLRSAQNLTAANDFFPLAIDLGDLDGDGDLDIVTSNYSSANFTVFENDGVGNFDLAATLNAPNKSSCAILHDRDNDGDLDISATDEGDDVVLLFENAGVSGVPEITRNLDLQVAPNPFDAQLVFEFATASQSDLRLEIWTGTGKFVHRLVKKEAGIGAQKINISTQDWVTGLYFYRLWSGDAVASGKVVKY